MGVGVNRALRVVRDSADLDRIKALPRRVLDQRAAERHAARLTPHYALAADAEFRPWQGACLAEAVKAGGLLAQLPVGQGKTLICETLPVALGARKAVLVVPASLEDKTYDDRRGLVGTWRVASPPPRLITRESMAPERNATMLSEIDPDLIIIDEADEFSNPNASAVRRLIRFVEAKRAKRGFASVRVCALTGTLTRRSILGYWHLLRLCLGDGAPVPKTRADAELWAAALDDAAPRAGWRPDPGALGSTLEKARAWYLERLRSTPGVVLCDEDSAADVPLRIRVELAPPCKAIEKAFKRLRKKYESPSGERVSDPLSEMRIDGHLGCGLYRYLDPGPPKEWREARRAFAAFVRKRCSETAHARRPLDTEAQVARAHPNAEPVVEWYRVRDEYDADANAHVAWLSDATLDWAEEWLLGAEEPSILWCGSVDFGVELAERAGVPYYGREGKERTTRRDLHAAKATRKDRVFVASWYANKRGFNLQAWRRHAIVMPPQSAKYLEQIFGRSHRAGQTETVRLTVLATSGGTLDSWNAALGEARFAKQTTAATQKILRAKIARMPTPPDTYRWARKTEDE